MATASCSTAQKTCLYLIHGHLFFCGVDLKLSTSLRKSLATRLFRPVLVVILRLLLLLSVMFYFLGKSIRIYNELQGQININKLFFVWYVLVAGLLFIEIICCQWCNVDIYKRILENEQNQSFIDCRRVFGWLVCLSIWTFVDLYLVFSNQQTRGLSQDTHDEQITDFWNVLRIVSERCEVYLFQIQHNCYVFFLVIPKVIQLRLEHLHSSLPFSSMDHVLESRLNIRLTTYAFNSLFRRVGSFIYAKLIAIGYRIVILMTTTNQPIRRVQILNSCLQFVVLYDMASSGTEIINKSRSLSTAFVVSQKFKLSHEQLFLASTELGYDVSQDAIMLSNCFTNEKSTLLSYTCTIITSIAILLQFDYTIMAQFDKVKLTAT